MKSKTGLFVLVAEIAVIIMLHSAKLSRSGAEKAGNQSQTESTVFQADQKPSVSYTSLK